MNDKIFDFRSDTVTRPTPAMRAAMAAAEVGNNVLGDNPTVIRLHLLRISPYLFLTQEERPTREDVELCSKGIDIRNAIMHRLVRKGKFKMPVYSENDYGNGFTGALALYKTFSKARRIFNKIWIEFH